MFTANVTVEGTTQRIRIIGLHAKAGATAADLARRVEDVKALKTELDAKYPRENLIIAGDFNDDVDVSITLGQPSTYVDFVKDSLNYKVVTKVLSDAGKKSTGNFTGIFISIFGIGNTLLDIIQCGSSRRCGSTTFSAWMVHRSTPWKSHTSARSPESRPQSEPDGIA